MKILILNGVNINKTGERESIYGERSLEQINADLADEIKTLGAQAEFFQSNWEGGIVDRLQQNDYDALIINAGAYSHYSHAIADALACVTVPKIEVHMTNILGREPFRAESVTAKNCDGVITGFGEDVYFMAAEYLVWKAAKREN